MKTSGVIHESGTVYGTGLIRLRARQRREGYIDASG